MSHDRTARIWDTESGEEVLQFNKHGGGVFAVSWSPSPNDEWIATGSRDGTVRLWNAKNGNEIRSFDHEKEGIWAVAFSPDGKMLATGATDNRARIWNVETGDLIQELIGHEGNVDAVAWSPNGKKLVTGSDDGRMRIFNLDDVRLKVDHKNLIELAKKRVNHCLSGEEREYFTLRKEAPKLCDDLGTKTGQ